MTLPLQTLRPLGLGELMDRSLRVWRANIVPLAKVMLPFAVASQLLMSLGVWSLSNHQEAMQQDPEDFVSAFIVLGGMMCFATVAMWLSWIGHVALSRAAYPLFTGQPAPPVGSRIHLFLAATWAFLGIGAIIVLVCAVAMIPLVLVGVLIALAIGSTGGSPIAVAIGVGGGVGLLFLIILLVFLWMTLRCYFAPAVLALESTSLRTVWRRCRELMSGRIAPGFLGRVPVRASILLTVVSAIVFSVQGIASFPMLGLQFAFSEDLSRLSVNAVPLILRLPAEAFVVAIQAITAPIFALFGMRFYLDQRVRREALDLELALEQRAA